MKIAIYTCITGGYDYLKEIPKEFLHEDLDFICFTDNPNLKSNTWKIKQIPSELNRLKNVKKQRCIKIYPFKFLPEYDVSVWIDGNIELKTDIREFLQKYDLTRYPLWTLKHPQRNCIYEEENAVLRMKKDVALITNPQISRYHRLGYPANNGLAETRIIYRDHKSEACRKTCMIWETEMLKGSHRDQLSFNYACWKNEFKYGEIDKDHFLSAFKIFTSHPKKNISQPIKVDEKLDENQKIKAIDIYTVNFNHSDLTNAWIKSIQKNVSGIDYRIFVVDNSDRIPFVLDESIDKSTVNIIDNTNDQMIPVRFATRYFSKIHILCNNNGSFKHCLTIQWILDNCERDHLLLFDCDTILKRNIDFLDPKYVTIADFMKTPKDKPRIKSRILPYIQYFNLNYIRRENIRYFDAERMHGGSSIIGNVYDTGASFTEDIQNKRLPYLIINSKTYINHLKGGTFKNDYPQKKQSW